MKDAMILLGPTTTGKTEHAFELAQHIGGAVINADKFYLFRGYPIGTGQTDRSDWSHTPSYLYNVLPPDADKPDVGDWLKQMLSKIKSLQQQGLTPIIEGSSFGLASAAVRQLRNLGQRVGAVGLCWDDASTLEARLTRRVTKALQAGVLAETRQLMKQGLQHNYVMRRSLVYQPLVAHLCGAQSLAEASHQIVDGCMTAAHAQLEKFKTLSDISWLTTSPSNPLSPQQILQACQ